jgi:hypothetical protein
MTELPVCGFPDELKTHVSAVSLMVIGREMFELTALGLGDKISTRFAPHTLAMGVTGTQSRSKQNSKLLPSHCVGLLEA